VGALFANQWKECSPHLHYGIVYSALSERERKMKKAPQLSVECMGGFMVDAFAAHDGAGPHII